MKYADVFSGQPLKCIVAGFLLNILTLETVELRVLERAAETDAELTLVERLVSTDDRSEKNAAIVEFAEVVFDPPLSLSVWRSVKEVLGRAVDERGIDPVDVARILVPTGDQPGTYRDIDLLWGLLTEWDDKPDCRVEYAARIRRFLVSP